MKKISCKCKDKKKDKRKKKVVKTTVLSASTLAAGFLVAKKLGLFDEDSK